MRINYKMDWPSLSEYAGLRQLGAKKISILESALKNIEKKGLHGLSLAQISEDTGISKPLVLYHFESLPKILEALYLYHSLLAQVFCEIYQNKETSFELKVRGLILSQYRWSFFNKESATFVQLMPTLSNKSYYLKKYSQELDDYLRKRWDIVFLESMRFKTLEEVKICVMGVRSLINGTFADLYYNEYALGESIDRDDTLFRLKFNLEKLLEVEIPNFSVDLKIPIQSSP